MSPPSLCSSIRDSSNPTPSNASRERALLRLWGGCDQPPARTCAQRYPGSFITWWNRSRIVARVAMTRTARSRLSTWHSLPVKCASTSRWSCPTGPRRWSRDFSRPRKHTRRGFHCLNRHGHLLRHDPFPVALISRSHSDQQNMSLYKNVIAQGPGINPAQGTGKSLTHIRGFSQ